MTSSQAGRNHSGRTGGLIAAAIGAQAERLLECRQRRLADLVDVLCGVDHAKSIRRRAREFQVTVAHPIEELRRLDFEAIDGAAPRLHALESDAHRHVEQQRAVGREIAVHGLREVFDECAVDTPSPALVGVRGIGEAIAQHPLAARQRGPDEIVHVYLPRAEHQQRFAGGRDEFLAAIQHQRANPFGDLGAAGLTRGVHGEAARAQRARDACRPRWSCPRLRFPRA